MRAACLSILCAVLWCIYWPVFWFAKYSQVAAYRGLQFRVTVPLATWAYKHFGGA